MVIQREQARNELARDGRAGVDAGARVLHLHPYDAGAKALEAEPCAAALRGVSRRADLAEHVRGDRVRP